MRVELKKLIKLHVKREGEVVQKKKFKLYSKIKKNNFSIKMSEADISSYHKTVIESFNFNIKSIRAYKRILCKNISMLYF